MLMNKPMNEFKPSLFTILMVDDNPKNLQLLGSTLRNDGYQLEFATSGPTALAWIEKKQFDLILLDIMMPDMSGFEVCAQLRKNKKMDDVPVIFLTAKTEKESIVQGFKLGAQDYVTKPFDTSELLARVRTHLELRYNKEQLKNMNLILEEKVKERTNELRIANENLQKANEDLILLDNAKSDFLHIISHEIRTPLNGIKGSLEIIKEYSLTESVQKLFNILDLSVSRLENFSITALKITQLKMGNYKMDVQSLPFGLLINTILAKASQKLGQKSLHIVKNIHNDNDVVMGDFELLTTCLTAIIDNAIKYSNSHGTITVSSKASAQNYLIEVADEGSGFSQKALNNLFKLFSPGEKHINENEGIELALAKLIMEAHSGEIEAINIETGGALVRLTFPKNIN
jgi:two-component system, sensor histidine kinase and response regulator